MKPSLKPRELTERRAADRDEMACRLVALAAQRGIQCEREEVPHGVMVGMRHASGLRVTIWLDGKGNPQPDNHCIAWNSDKRLSRAFGIAAGADVNPCHGCKCTAFAQGFNALYAALERGFVMADASDAFAAGAL